MKQKDLIVRILEPVLYGAAALFAGWLYYQRVIRPIQANVRSVFQQLQKVNHKIKAKKSR